MNSVVQGVVVGNGMLSRAFAPSVAAGPSNRCFFASGVSNSAGEDPAQFSRERSLLLESLERHRDLEAFVYFGTCAAAVPGNEGSAYVRHKLGMEALVLAQDNGRVVRLPQVAGPNASPHTLLSALCSRIKSGLPVVVRAQATRNIIDVADVVPLVNAWLSASDGSPRMINIANTHSYPVLAIVDTIETVLGIRAHHELLAAGEPYEVDTSAMAPSMAECGVVFDDGYLARTIARYYQ